MRNGVRCSSFITGLMGIILIIINLIAGMARHLLSTQVNNVGKAHNFAIDSIKNDVMIA
jgi:choline-glycine betaine transporter